MIDLMQSAYNPVQLGWAVIEHIAWMIKEQGNWDDTLETTFQLDRGIFDDENSGEDFHAIEDEWRNSIGWKFGILVTDDGEAGYTYVGTIAEIDAMLNENEAL